MNFSMKVTSTTSRTSGSTKPEIEVTCTDGKFKANDLATNKLNVESGDCLAFVSNMDAVNTWALENNLELRSQEVMEKYQFGIMKGYAELDANGEQIMTKDRKTGEEVPRFKGSKLLSINGKAGVGQICEFTDNKHYSAMGGNNEMIQIFTLDMQNVGTVECEDGEEREFYPLVYDREEPKQVKVKKA